jgi:hypothetical protein
MPTTTIFKASRFSLPTPAVHYICQTWWSCSHGAGSRYEYRERFDSLLSTAELLSVIRPSALKGIDLEIMPERGWRGHVLTWRGVPCRLGRVRVWLPIEEGPDVLRPLPLLALFPKEDVEDAPPFVQLGTQFLLEHKVQLTLDASSIQGEGRLVIPE